MTRRVIPGSTRDPVPALALSLASALTLPAAALAQSPCPKPAEVTHEQLHGLWRAEVEGQRGATLLLERHAEVKLAVSGTINRNGDKAALSGEIEDGEFALEESADGVRISATWIGDVVEGSCGREIRGTWQKMGEEKLAPFILRKR